jgi:hypothetical protein
MLRSKRSVPAGGAAARGGDQCMATATATGTPWVTMS